MYAFFVCLVSFFFAANQTIQTLDDTIKVTCGSRGLKRHFNFHSSMAARKKRTNSLAYIPLDKMNKFCHLIRACKRSFHSNNIVYRPRHITKPNRFGNFQRISPATLAPINVRNMTRYPVPDSIMKPPYAEKGTSSNWAPELVLQSDDDVKGMRKAGQLARQALQLGATLCQPGVTTNAIDRTLHQFIIENNAYPSPLNYMGFPKSVCTSINNIIAHGIPDDRPLQNGDIINIDVTVKNKQHV